MRAQQGTWRHGLSVFASACGHVIVLLALLVAGGHAALAESLSEALASAYMNDPRIDAAISTLRATDESLAVAQSGYRPTVSVNADVDSQRLETEQLSAFSSRTVGGQADGTSHPKGWTIQAQESLFDGYQTVSQVRKADANIRAQREILRNTEQQVLLEAVRAYVNVVRDRAIVKLRQSNVDVLSQELKATEERFAVGEVTKTDVAQAKARLAGAISAREAAEGNRRASEGDFERVIGHAPGVLEVPRPAEHLQPRSLDEAIGIGQSEHPSIASALFQEEAAKHNVDQVYGQMLPSVQLSAQFQQRFDTTTVQEKFEQGQLIARLTVPIYQGGQVAAEVRQAKHQRFSALESIETARLQVRSDVTSTWSQLVSARAQLQSDKVQVESTRIAFDGVKEEEKVGQRTLIDVLDAEQEYLNAQVSLVSDQRDLVFAAYSLVSAVGRLSPSDLGLGTQPYDVEPHYDEVNGKWGGLTIEEDEAFTGKDEPPAPGDISWEPTAVTVDPPEDPNGPVDTSSTTELPKVHGTASWQVTRSK